MKVGVNITKGSKSESVVDIITVSYVRNINTGKTSIDLSSYNPTTIKEVFVKGITNLQYTTDSYQAFTPNNLIITYISGESNVILDIAVGARLSALSCNVELALVR